MPMLKNAKKTITVGLGGGCHWCTEAVYSSLKGVISVEQGWISAHSPHDTFSEAVLIVINEREISLQKIIEIHLNTHSATSNHHLRNKYRSAVYVMNEEDKSRSISILEKLQTKFNAPLVTQVLDFKCFKKSDKAYIDYHYRNPNKPFCQTYIQPKLKKLLKHYPDAINKSKISSNKT